MTLSVIGLGNVLLGDDGFGPFVIEVLRRRYEFPPDVELFDLGTPGLGLITYLQGHDAVVIVDAVAGPGIPGDVRLYEGIELERLPRPPRVSPHDPAVSEALWVSRLAGRGPQDVVLVGAVPGSLELGPMSPRMCAAADEAAEIVRMLIEARGIKVRRRNESQVEPDWWTRAHAMAESPVVP